MNPNHTNWPDLVHAEMENFAKDYGSIYSKTKKELFAFFEIGCFLALVKLYNDNQCIIKQKNLSENNEYKYLTTPNGNPKNFSYIEATCAKVSFEIRQQVRVVSHINPDIAFTPDIVVLKSNADISSKKDIDYAGGKRSLFFVPTKDVIAAHECKSYSPYPELLISFVGSLLTGHLWAGDPSWRRFLVTDKQKALHPAPTLFAGGSARIFQQRMIQALEKEFPINIVAGMHSGITSLKNKIHVFINPDM